MTTKSIPSTPDLAGVSVASELLRCPFCSCELMPNTNQDDLYVKRYGTHWNHPDGPCFLADMEVSPSQVDAWNRRSTAPTTGSAPDAKYEVFDEEARVWFAVDADYYAMAIPDKRRIKHLSTASPAASDPMVIARLKESLRAKSSAALTVTCWRADLIALLAASMGGDKS